MRSLRYLNSILTVIAVLLTMNLWVAWHSTPAGQALVQEAHAQASGMPNAAEQRKQMVDLLKQTNVHLADMKATLKSGVTVKSDAAND